MLKSDLLYTLKRNPYMHNTKDDSIQEGGLSVSNQTITNDFGLYSHWCQF